jgi:hypothetical protein
VNIEVIEELKKICIDFEKKQNRGSSFRPFRYNKYKDGQNSPVFFVGSPGLSVAIYATILIFVTFYLFSLPFIWWAWILYIMLGAFFMKVAFKMDRIKQIKTLALALSLQAIRILEILNNEEKNKEEQIKLLEKAKEFLTESSNYLAEPLIEQQLEIVSKKLNDLK